MRLNLLLPVLLVISSCLYGQQGRIEFGKNRVQFHKNFDEWSKYESENFIAYWYGVGRYVGQAAVQLAEYDFAYVQRILEHRINEKVQLIVYTDLTDLKQSNIGSEETFENSAEITKVVGKKIFVYFNGDHNHLRKQIRAGIATIYLESMLYGASLTEVIQNAVLLSLPDWFKPGLISYVGENWTTSLDNELKELLKESKYKNFEKFASDYPTLAGHSFWYFISEVFGDATVSNLLYLTRINRSLESGFVYVLGTTYQAVANGWYEFFTERFEREDAQRVVPSEDNYISYKNRRNLPVTQVKISPDGEKLAYVLNENSKIKVYLLDLTTGKSSVVFKQGSKNLFQETDYEYPLISWSPSGIELCLITEKRDIIQIKRYDTGTQKWTNDVVAPPIERVHSMDYASSNSLILSATIGGFSDLVIYYLNSRQSQRITNDFYDDLDVATVNLGNRKGVVFSSNRGDSDFSTQKLDTILPIENFDVYYFPLDRRNAKPLRLTNTPFANERNPVALDTTYVGFLSDESGIFNQRAVYLEPYTAFYNKVYYINDGTEILLHEDSVLVGIDSLTIDSIIRVPEIKERVIQKTLTNNVRNQLLWHTSPRAGVQVGTMLKDGRQIIYRTPVGFEEIKFVPYTLHIQNKLRRLRPDLIKVMEKEEEQVKEERPPIRFQTPFRFPEETSQVAANKSPFEERMEQLSKRSIFDLPNNLHAFRPGRITSQRLMFRNDFITSKMDNELLFEGLESFAANPDGFGFQPMGLLTKANFKDLFEDYELEVGARIPTSFNGGEFYGLFRDKKRRLDKTYALYRKVNKFDLDSPSNYYEKQEKDVLLGQFGLRYPLDIFRSFRLTTTVRRDRTTWLATAADPQRNFYPFNEPTTTEERVGLKAEYVFDNTLDVSLNIKIGTRYKIYGEVVKKFDVNTTDGLKINFAKGFMTILGLDARHYERFLKHGVLAFRVAAATSFGSEKMLYYLGGTENWLIPSRNEDIPTPQGVNFAYQTLAANMRGFRNNIRNGSSFALFNAEMRLPVFTYLFPNSTSSFIKNFQAVGFFDAGTAWEGSNPYNSSNPLNTKTYPDDTSFGDPLVEIQVNFFRDPVVAGYGFGLRTTLFGYFIRADYAWGIETKVVQPPRLYLSLGLDF